MICFLMYLNINKNFSFLNKSCPGISSFFAFILVISLLFGLKELYNLFHKRMFYFFRVCLVAILVFNFHKLPAQVFNSSAPLGDKVFSVGLQPAQYGKGRFVTFIHGDLRLASGVCLTAKGGLGSTAYFGAGFKFNLLEHLAFNLGAHQADEMGFDASVIFALPVSESARVVTGIDADWIPAKDGGLYFRVPVGLEARISSAWSVMLEGDLGVSQRTFDIFGGGMIIYL